MPNIKTIKYLIKSRSKPLIGLYQRLYPGSYFPPETIEIPLDKPVEFRDGEEKTITATFTVPED